MANLKNTKPSPNFVDLTGVSGPDRLRWIMIDNFLNARQHNRQSYNNDFNENNPYGRIIPGKKFPFRPVEAPEGNMIRDFLLNPNYFKDHRQSKPDKKSDFFKMLLDRINFEDFYRQGSSIPSDD